MSMITLVGIQRLEASGRRKRSVRRKSPSRSDRRNSSGPDSKIGMIWDAMGASYVKLRQSRNILDLNCLN